MAEHTGDGRPSCRWCGRPASVQDRRGPLCGQCAIWAQAIDQLAERDEAEADDVICLDSSDIPIHLFREERLGREVVRRTCLRCGEIELDLRATRQAAGDQRAGSPTAKG